MGADCRGGAHVGGAVTDRRYLPPLPTGRPRKREYVYAAIALILMLVVHTQDYSAAVVTEAIVIENAQRTVECQKLKEGQWLRYTVKQRNDLGFEWHQCVYGPVWLEVANEWNGH